MEPAKNILIRLRLIYLLICLSGLIILTRAFLIGVIQREVWMEKKKQQTMRFQTIEPIRGNLYSADGSLLATSLPIYDIRMDLNSDAVRSRFESKLDSLAEGLAEIFSNQTGPQFKSKVRYKYELKKAYEERNGYFLIRKAITYAELKKVQKLPLLRRTANNRGGLIVEQQSRREMPFRSLAFRTLGRYREGIKPIGIEGAYNDYLKGVSGKRLMQKISGGVWKPVNDENEIEPKDGNDIITTIDIAVQDVAEAELLRQLKLHDAKYGCAILMEVETGYIRAIANLGKSGDSSYTENYNYALGGATEPGSTIKLASVMALIEDKFADTSDILDSRGGEVRFGDQTMRDSHDGGYGKISLGKAFRVSSNTVISQAVNRAYYNKPDKFIEKLKKFHLDKKAQDELPGEANPLIREPRDKGWSRVTLPWMSVGYELLLTPLQILTFYNAIANNGKMMKPQFVQEIRYKGNTLKKFSPVVIDPAICSSETIKKVKPLLEGVVKEGTAKNLNSPFYQIAGKTGTAQIADGGYRKENQKHQASFVGYFPADNPKYSCIVVVFAPSKGVYFANLVAGPVFKEISDKVYAKSIQLHDNHEQVASARIQKDYSFKPGNSGEINILTKGMGLKKNNPITNAWVKARNENGNVEFSSIPVMTGKMPDVVGMGLKDALFLLENSGLKVKIVGKGAVRYQSMPPGFPISRIKEVTIELS